MQYGAKSNNNVRRMKKNYLTFISALFTAILGIQCADQPGRLVEQADSFYPLQSASIRKVKLTDGFWLPIIQRVQEKTIQYAIEKCRDEGRMDNFLIAGGQLDGTVKGAMPFDDTDLYKIIEGASISLVSAPNDQLEILLDELIEIIKVGQETDGYLTTWRTINPAQPPAPWVKVDKGERWESLFMSHELYNAGHLYEAAAEHYAATGKKNFLNIALANADLMVKTFGEGEGKIAAVPGHQVIETGLIKLYRITGKEAYLELARYFLDHRGTEGHHELFGWYSQDHEPVIKQKEVVGYAVRAVYMYAAMTDIATLQKDEDYLKATHALWDNMVSKKMYITGGIGAVHDGERFGNNYELPNLTAYNETCAAIGDVYWNHRLHSLTADPKYFDVIERTLYNGLISGLSLDGTKFFYPNALESDGEYEFNRGKCTRQGWFDCSCCPTNIVRFIPSIPKLLYSTKANELFVNLYASNISEVQLEGQTVSVIEKANMPWDGKVSIKLNFDKPRTDFILKLRVPYWVTNQVLPSDLYSYNQDYQSEIKLSLNGEQIAVQQENGYIVLDRSWFNSDELVIDFPMETRSVSAHPLVKENEGKLSVERGPIVYAFEEIDNKGVIDDIKLDKDAEFEANFESELLEGVTTLRTDRFKAIPYYSWSNRGIGKMKVWIEESRKGQNKNTQN